MGYTLGNTKGIKRHGNFAIPETKLRRDLLRLFRQLNGRFPNLTYEQQRELINFCTVLDDTTQTEANYLELMDLLAEKGVSVSVIHSSVRTFSRATKAVALRLLAAQRRKVREERRHSVVVQATSASR